MKRIHLTGKYSQNGIVCAIVDDEDYGRLAQFKWKAKPNGAGNNVYAVRNVWIDGKSVTLRMHREVLRLSSGDGRDVDHINHNSLDNRKSNLRTVSRSQNLLNQRTAIIKRNCERCGKPFERKCNVGVRKRIKYCSSKCLNAKKPAPRKEYERHCAWCQSEFVTCDKRQKYCRSKCRYDFKNHAAK